MSWQHPENVSVLELFLDRRPCELFTKEFYQIKFIENYIVNLYSISFSCQAGFKYM